jgi:uncharacterized coiled-coil protein SlyX
MTHHTTEELIGGRSEWAVSPNNFNGLIDSHILANQRISELEAQLAAQHERVIMLEVSYAEKPEALSDANEMLAELESQLAVEKETWRCFHCGFETADRAEAEVHFGARDDAEEFKPFCRWWASMSPEERGEALQDTIKELNSERDENAVLRSKIDGLEYRIHGIVSEIKSFKPFRDCESIHQVFHVYDSMEGRMLVAEEKLAERDRQLKTAREALEELDSKSSLVPHWTSHLSDACLSNCPRCLVRKALVALDGEV